jgi:hypothetical protein
MMLTLTMAAGLAACGSSSSGSGSGGGTPAGEPTTGAGATEAITTLYTNFFNAPPAQAAAMLEDGASLGAAFKAAEKLQAGNTESAKVKTVKLTGPTTAAVTFELDVNGSPAIPSSDGQAVYVNGKWLVAKATFCGLVDLGVKKPPAGC